MPQSRGAWSSFLDEPSDLDPLVRMAAAHYQFEAIHPFTDGNGRTGRIRNILMLCDAGLLHLPLLYLSRYVIEFKGECYGLLGRVTSDEAWEQWVLYVVEGARSTSVRTVGLIERIEAVQAHLVDEARKSLGSVNQALVASDLHPVRPPRSELRPLIPSDRGPRLTSRRSLCGEALAHKSGSVVHWSSNEPQNARWARGWAACSTDLNPSTCRSPTRSAPRS